MKKEGRRKIAMNAKVKGTAFALFGGACWGLSSVVGKLLFDMRGMNAEWLVTARLVFGGFIMLNAVFFSFHILKISPFF